MLINHLKGLFATLALGLLAACATPCGAPGGLCAPQQANTSEQPGPRAPATPAPAPAPPESAPAPALPIRIALLVPLQSATLGLPAEAVRDGFLAAHDHDGDGVQIDVIATGDSVPDVLDAYARAAAGHDIVVGPLARAAVGAVAQGPAPTRPTIALNHPESGIALPHNMLAIGLSIEDEARQAADWAAREHPEGRAFILAGGASWQKRMAQAFEARWSELGRNSHLAEVTADGGKVDPDAVDVVRTRIEVDTPELVFAALDADQLRQVRGVLGTSITCYAASPANPGRLAGTAVAELNGLRLLDVPWEVQPDHQAVMVYPRWVASGHTLDIDRLYALGIDAFRLAHAIALHPGAPQQLDGVTGKLDASLDQPASFQRTEAAVVYHEGAFEPVGR